jgi:Na+/proline symporter
VATRLPVGLSGLVITAIFAAAMSSIDSCMNAASAVCVEDFLWPVFGNATCFLLGLAISSMWRHRRMQKTHYPISGKS